MGPQTIDRVGDVCSSPWPYRNRHGVPRTTDLWNRRLRIFRDWYSHGLSCPTSCSERCCASKLESIIFRGISLLERYGLCHRSINGRYCRQYFWINVGSAYSWSSYTAFWHMGLVKNERNEINKIKKCHFYIIN